MKNILVIDDIKEKVEKFKEIEGDNQTVIFAYSFDEALNVLRDNPKMFDKIFLDYDLDNRHTGLELLEYIKNEDLLKPGCRIRPNSSSEKCNFLIKKKIVELGLTRREINKNLD